MLFRRQFSTQNNPKIRPSSPLKWMSNGCPKTGCRRVWSGSIQDLLKHSFLPNFQAWPAAQKMSKKSTKSAPNNSPIFTHYFDKTSCLKNEQKIVWISIPNLHPFTPNFAADTSIPPNTQKSNKLLNKHFWHAKTITIFRKINRLAIFMLSN